MTEERDDFDRQLADRLRAHEARVPVSGEATLAPPASNRLRVAAAASVVVVAVLAVGIPNLLKPTAVDPSPSPSASPGTPPPTATAAESSASPAPTIAPRAGWSVHQVADDVADARIRHTSEARGRLYALGIAGFGQPGIWVSPDGGAWTQTDVPATENGLVADVWDIVESGGHLVALAPGGAAEGSGYFATMMYTSADGESWRIVEATPGIEAGAHFALISSGDRLLALGEDVWTSLDGGRSWSVSTTESNVNGMMRSAVERDGVIVAVGALGTGDLVNPPGLLWISTDGGVSWTRRVLSTEGIPTGVTLGPEGQVLVVGYRDQSPVVWISNDSGNTWADVVLPGEGAISDVITAPEGYVAIGEMTSADARVAWTSIDGQTWTPGIVPMDGAYDVDWTPSFGVVVAGDSLSIALGPQPFPIAAAELVWGTAVIEPYDPTVPGPFFGGIRWFEGFGWLAFGAFSETRAGIWTSPDGSTWARAQLPGALNADFVVDIDRGVVSGQYRYVAIVSDRLRHTEILVSEDGEAWRASVVPDSRAAIDAVAWGDGGFVAVGTQPYFASQGDTDGRVWRSKDGLTWSERAPAELADAIPFAIDSLGPNGYVALGFTERGRWQATAWTSRYGTAWDAHPVGPASDVGYLHVDSDAESGQVGMVGTGREGYAAFSVDGTSWSIEPLDDTGTMEAIDLIGGTAVAVQNLFIADGPRDTYIWLRSTQDAVWQSVDWRDHVSSTDQEQFESGASGIATSGARTAILFRSGTVLLMDGVLQ
jgi:hypothetical protein